MTLGKREGVTKLRITVANGGKKVEEKEELTYEEKREIAWKLTQELLEAIPGEPRLYVVESILEEMQGFIHARTIVPRIED